jgi:hypothetical protein
VPTGARVLHSAVAEMKRTLVVALCIVAAACSKSSSSPTAPQASTVLLGQTVRAIDGSAAGSVSIQIGSRFAIQSDDEGNFQIDVGEPGTFATVANGGRVVERRTSITGPAADRTLVSLIPATFDLEAFDEMFRSSGRLQRWVSQPSLVISGAVLKYERNDADRYEATGEKLSDGDVETLVSHLSEGLALLTAGAYPTFASVNVEWPAAGEEVLVQRRNSIVVGRYSGINSMAQAIGYGGWAEMPDGTIRGGSIWLDRDFDENDGRRRLLRIHELGHALGYNHVTRRTSIMNPAIGPEPTDFDRAGAVIAFKRPVGNTAPDTDPSTSSRTSSISEGGLRRGVTKPSVYFRTIRSVTRPASTVRTENAGSRRISPVTNGSPSNTISKIFGARPGAATSKWMCAGTRLSG